MRGGSLTTLSFRLCRSAVCWSTNSNKMVRKIYEFSVLQQPNSSCLSRTNQTIGFCDTRPTNRQTNWIFSAHVLMAHMNSTKKIGSVFQCSSMDAANDATGTQGYLDQTIMTINCCLIIEYFMFQTFETWKVSCSREWLNRILKIYGQLFRTRSQNTTGKRDKASSRIWSCQQFVYIIRIRSEEEFSTVLTIHEYKDFLKRQILIHEYPTQTQFRLAVSFECVKLN